MSKKKTVRTEYPVFEIDGHVITVIEWPIKLSDIPPGLFIYDARPGHDATTLELSLHKQGPLTVPALVCADQLSLEADGTYSVRNWNHVAPEPFGPWLLKLVDQYNTRADEYYKSIVHLNESQGFKPYEKPNFIRQVVIPVLEHLARILPTPSRVRVPKLEKCELNWGIYKIYIGEILVGGIAPSFDREIPLYFAVAIRIEGVGLQHAVKTLEQLAILVACQYEIYCTEYHPRRQKVSK